MCRPGPTGPAAKQIIDHACHGEFPREPLRVGMVKVVEEGRVIEVTLMVGIIYEVVSRSRVISDEYRHTICLKGVRAGAE